MRNVSDTYNAIMADPDHWFETRLEIGEPGVVITERAEPIVFGRGGDEGEMTILVAAGGPEAGFDEGQLYDMTITRKLFANNVPEVGCCVSSEITVRMRRAVGTIPRMARLVPWIRVTNGELYSEWLQKGVFYIDTREYSNDTDNEVAELHGFDAMLMTEQPFPSNNLQWPAKDWQVVKLIADHIGVAIDSRTWQIITSYGNANQGYNVQLPVSYTCREVLGYIGAMYAGNWTMNDLGELRLVGLNEMPEDTRYLNDHAGNVLTFADTGHEYDSEGAVRILV